jgi:hypothetical protein
MPLKHLVRLLTLLALLLAPLGMLSSHAAMATPAPSKSSAGGHCAEMGGARHDAPEEPAPANTIDCTMVCSCIPPLGARLGEPPLRSEAPRSRVRSTFDMGLHPEAEPRPPRPS